MENNFFNRLYRNCNLRSYSYHHKINEKKNELEDI